MSRALHQVASALEPLIARVEASRRGQREREVVAELCVTQK